MGFFMLEKLEKCDFLTKVCFPFIYSPVFHTRTDNNIYFLPLQEAFCAVFSVCVAECFTMNIFLGKFCPLFICLLILVYCRTNMLYSRN